MTGRARPGSVLPSAAPVRVAVLIADPDRLGACVRWFEDHAPGFRVAVAARTWPDLVLSPGFPAELVLLDADPGARLSLEARVRTCRAAGARVVVVSDVDAEPIRARAMAAGAEDVVTTCEQLAGAVAAARAAAVRPPRAVALAARAVDAARADDRPKLSPGETQALRLYAAGLSTREVAARMNVQYETAKTYLRRVRQKYARVDRPASRRADLARRAAEDGYVR